MIEVIPAIIPKNYKQVHDDVAQVKDYVKTVQIDVMDGEYAPEPSWPYNGVDFPQFRALVDQNEGLPYWELIDFEIDMMTLHPEEKIDDWISVGAKTLIIHKHSTDDETLEKIFERCSERGVEVALALKPSTPNEELAPFIEHTAFIQCMGNDKIGFHGVALDPSVLDKIRDLKERFGDIPVGVDIGVNFETAPGIIEAGATRLVSGSAIYGSDDIHWAVERLKA